MTETVLLPEGVLEESIIRYNAFENRKLVVFIQNYLLAGDLTGKPVMIHSSKIEKMLEEYLKTQRDVAGTQ